MFEDDENLDKAAKSAASNSYEETLEQLQEILKNIENQGNEIGGLLQNVEQANALVQQCRDQLRGIENRVNNIL
ncbi:MULTISPECIES: exodeoxyribonuclease VII small subunit [unclassified Aureispira]|uniref:exodeoxyribonuclease VII small subunit n=1 Tax=unclassified Aureispira TaxID=2649989 RepID=UPI0006990E1E|nr:MULTISPECIES: exodeoxyribonuclease VII small subunit [unclassified Aureispira]WMX14059.1 exodeoxyribonuclease VII small subunit [Aureispira sp. CCB-E]